MLTAFPLTVRAFIISVDEGVLGVHCEIPVCSRRFVWRMGWSAAWLNRSGNARRTSEGSYPFIHPTIL